MEHPLPKELKLISTYSRVSTSRQEEEKTIETQLSTLREYADKNGYKIVEEYTDEGWSGDNLIRPALDQLRIDAKKKIWQAVLIYDPDRLARRYSYQEIVMDELNEQGIETLFVTVPPIKDENDQLLYEMRGSFARYERTKIAERFRMGKLRKVKAGHLLLSEPAYGYNYIKKQALVHGYYEINEEESKVVVMIFRFVADDGMTIRQVVRKLQVLGIKPRKSKRGVWNTSTLGHILRNKAYIGRAHWGSSYAVVPDKPYKQEKYKKIKKSSRRIKPESEWLTIPTPSIISQDLYDRAQEQLKRNFNLSWRNKKNDYLLGGIIHCDCGRRRCGEGAQKGKHLYYRCGDRVKSFPLPQTCFEGGINARVTDDLVWNKISGLMSSEKLMKEQISKWMKKQHQKPSEALQDAGNIEKEILKLKEQEARYTHAYAMETFTLEDLKTYLAPLRERVSLLEAQIAQIKQKGKEVATNPLPKQEDIENFAQEYREALLDLSFSQKRSIILNTVEKVVAVPGKLQVSGYISVASHVEYKSIHRNCGATECGEIHAF